MRPPIAYLFRAKEDLLAILNREPPPSTGVRIACESALSDVLLALDSLDPGSRDEKASGIEPKLPCLKDTCKSSGMHFRDICEWLAGRDKSKETACQILYMICGDLEESQPCARPEIGEALQHLESAIEQLNSR